jgi:hypothetical protein
VGIAYRDVERVSYRFEKQKGLGRDDAALPRICFCALHVGEGGFAVEDGVFGAVQLFACEAVSDHAGFGGCEEVEILLEVCAFGVSKVGLGGVAASELVGELDEAAGVFVHGEVVAFGGQLVGIDVGVDFDFFLREEFDDAAVFGGFPGRVVGYGKAGEGHGVSGKEGVVGGEGILDLVDAMV